MKARILLITLFTESHDPPRNISERPFFGPGSWVGGLFSQSPGPRLRV